MYILCKREHSEDAVLFCEEGWEWIYDDYELVAEVSDRGARYLKWIGGFGKAERLSLRSATPELYVKSRINFAASRIGWPHFKIY